MLLPDVISFQYPVSLLEILAKYWKFDNRKMNSNRQFDWRETYHKQIAVHICIIRADVLYQSNIYFSFYIKYLLNCL